METNAQKYREKLNRSLLLLKEAYSLESEIVMPLLRTVANGALFGFFALGQILKNLVMREKLSSGLKAESNHDEITSVFADTYQDAMGEMNKMDVDYKKRSSKKVSARPSSTKITSVEGKEDSKLKGPGK